MCFRGFGRALSGSTKKLIMGSQKSDFIHLKVKGVGGSEASNKTLSYRWGEERGPKRSASPTFPTAPQENKNMLLG